MGVFQRHLRAGKAEELMGVRYQLIHALRVMYSRHAGSVAAHRRCAATLASARPPCRLSARHISFDSNFAVVEKPLQPIKSLKAEQAGAFFSSESGEKKRTGRVGLGVTSIGMSVLSTAEKPAPTGRVGLGVT